MEKEYKEISLCELEPGMILLYHGTKFLAKKIQWFQKQKYPHDYVLLPDTTKMFFYNFNHVGSIDLDVDRNAIVYQQDNPGRFMPDRLDHEYLKERGDVWIGVPKCDYKTNMSKMREEEEILSGADVLLNYSYKSFFSFMADALWYKITGKDCWITGVPKGSTCSQIVAKLYNKYFGMFSAKIWYKWFPCEIAMSEEIELRKLIY